MRTVLSVLFLTALGTHAVAEEDAVSKYREFTPDQIAAVPEDERRSSVPMMYTMAASTALSPGSELLFSMQLNRLMYNGIGDLPGAVRAFQIDIGEAATGVLTVGQISDLEFRSEMQSLERVGFPNDHYSNLLDDNAYVTGTVTILDDRIAYPINYVQIACNREGAYCRYDQLVMMLPSKDSWAQTYQVHKFDTEFYRIIRWEGKQIDAVPNTSPTACRTNTLSLNFDADEFYEIARNKTDACDIGGVSLPKLDRPRVSQIVDGGEIFDSEFNRLKAEAFEYLSR